MFSGTGLNSFVPRDEKVTKNHTQFLITKIVFLIANTVTGHTIAKGLLKLLADLTINIVYVGDTTSYRQNPFIK